jgi:hypothetical protein
MHIHSAHFEGIPHVPRPLLLSGYLAKKSRSGSTFRPWSDRFVEILPDGYLTYKAVKKVCIERERERLFFSLFSLSQPPPS